ncbi:MAG: hypothetical protein NUV82_03540 [Candidatus Komeilibacteria bacterium]|nr:hypothetical protein [Candidatus Komeilibacteria bacterium]
MLVNKPLYIVASVLLLIALVGFIFDQQTMRPLTSGSTAGNGDTIDDIPAVLNGGDFDFIFRYGVDAKNELNTISDRFTRDMVMEPAVTVEMRLSEEEMADIYQKIVRLNLLSKDPNPSKNTRYVTPCSTYSLNVSMDGVNDELKWSDCQAEIDINFRVFTDYLIQLIHAHPEYKNLPVPTGGYQ